MVKFGDFRWLSIIGLLLCIPLPKKERHTCKKFATKPKYYRKNSICTLCALEARKSMSPEEFYQTYGTQNKFSRISRFGQDETDDDDGSSTDHAGKYCFFEFKKPDSMSPESWLAEISL